MSTDTDTRTLGQILRSYHRPTMSEKEFLALCREAQTVNSARRFGPVSLRRCNDTHKICIEDETNWENTNILLCYHGINIILGNPRILRLRRYSPKLRQIIYDYYDSLNTETSWRSPESATEEAIRWIGVLS